MEKIDLNNYEAYFLDFMEGTLSAEEKHDLFAFLALHPELKSEMEADFGDLELSPEAITFEWKADLKIDENTLILTSNTVDDVMIASVEGQLSAAHDTELQHYIKANGLEETFAYYKASILKADTTIVFAEKRKLKVKTGLVITLPLITRFAAIAAVGVVLLTVAFRNWDTSNPIIENEIGNEFALVGRSNTTIDFTKVRGQVNGFDVVEQSNNQISPRQKNYLLPDFIEDDVVIDQNSTQKDSTDEEVPLERMGLDKEGSEILNEDQIAEDIPVKTPATDPGSMDEDPLVILASVKTEEPYKVVTNAASNLVNRDVSFTRDRDVKSNDYVAYSFKVGKFEFERKKSR